MDAKETNATSEEEVAWVHLPANFEPTQLSHSEFTSALEDLLLNQNKG